MKLNIGILGVGYLGKLHIENLQKIKEVNIIGFYDPNDINATIIENSHQIKRFNDVESLIDKCDALDIVAPTSEHYQLCLKCLEKDKHVFIEKPVTATVQQAKEIEKILDQKKLIVQVGHIERFNPTYTAVSPLLNKPTLIESHRIAQFKPRALDVNVILDLMIHDIDLVCSIVKSDIQNISVISEKVYTDQVDIVSAQLVFKSGCKAILTASRIANCPSRIMKILDSNNYFELDFMNRKAVVKERLPFGTKSVQEILMLDKASDIEVNLEVNPLFEELKCFVSSINNNIPPLVTFKDGLLALEIACSITEFTSTNSVFDKI